MQHASEFIEWLQQRGVARADADCVFVERHLATYRLLHGETPQWLATLHAAMAAGHCPCTPAALAALKQRALEDSGAGAGAWRLLHAAGDAALTRHSLRPGLPNLVALLKIAGASAPAVLPDARLIDLLCDDDDHAWRDLPPLALMPGAVLRAVQRALRVTTADFSELDVGARADVRQVLDWARHEPGSAGSMAAMRGWGRLVAEAGAWHFEHPGQGAPSALPLQLRSGHLEAVQLRTSTDLKREALAMNNCLGGAAAAAAARRPDRAFFSIRDRRSRQTVADLELAYWPRSRRWAVVQIKGPGNDDAPPDARAFARALCASVSPRLQLRVPKALPAAAAGWAEAHADPGAARLAARFGLMLARRDAAWVAPFVTRQSRYRGALGVETRGDALLDIWRREFTRRARRPQGELSPLRLLRLPSDERNAPHCVFDVGAGLRALSFAADGDGRLGIAAEVLDRKRIARLVEAGEARQGALPLPN